MEFFLEMLLTAVVALLFSFLVAKLVSLSTTAGTSGGVGNDQAEIPAEIGVGDADFVKEELRFSMDARVVQSVRNLRVVDENVGHVDRFGFGADRVGDELEEASKGEESAAEGESLAEVSPENVVAEEMVEDERRHSAVEVSGEIGAESKESIVRTADDESTASVSPENVIAEEIMIRGQEEEEGRESTEGRRNVCPENVKSGDDVVRDEESSTVVKISNVNTEGEEEDDDWEGIEKSELEKAFASASKHLEESGKAEEIGGEAKMELYGLHKIATEGSCRETQPMAVMVSARAKWNAWQKLGNMSQEEAMEQYLALVSKEIPGFMTTCDDTVGKMSEIETSLVLPHNSGSLEDPTTLDTTGVESSKNG